MEQKTDRIEALLNQILNNQSESREAADARTEKLVTDKLDPIKEGFRSDRSKIENLEAGKRYNFVTMAVIGAFLFSVFTYFSSQQIETNKQLVLSQSSVLKNEFISLLGQTKGEVESVTNQNRSDIATLTAIVGKHSAEDIDYQNFKGVVTAQNAVSITDRGDAQRRIVELQQAETTINKELGNLTARIEEKFGEVETQFNAEEQLHNVQFSDQQRVNNMVVGALHDLGAKMPDYPNAPFFHPNISQQSKDGITN